MFVSSAQHLKQWFSTAEFKKKNAKCTLKNIIKYRNFQKLKCILSSIEWFHALSNQ